MTACRTWVMLGGLFAALAVVFGAFAAHGLESKIEPRSIDNIKTGAHYQLTHALGLIAVGVMAGLRRRSADASNPGGFASDSSAGNGWLTSAGVLLTLGIVLFSGSLYCLELSPLVTGAQLRWFGMIAPLGGTSMILGWLALAIGGSRRS